MRFSLFSYPCIGGSELQSIVLVRGKAGSGSLSLPHSFGSENVHVFNLVLGLTHFQQITATAKISHFIFDNFISPLFTWVLVKY